MRTNDARLKVGVATDHYQLYRNGNRKRSCGYNISGGTLIGPQTTFQQIDAIHLNSFATSRSSHAIQSDGSRTYIYGANM